VQLFVRDRAELERHVEAAIAAVEPGGRLWICYPKGSARVPTDLNRDRLWTAVEPYGVVGVSLVSIDDAWSAMRFRPPAEVGSR
jgi:hypothetical protein